MHTYLTPDYQLWLEPVVVLAIGASAIAVLAAVAGRLVRTAAWRRTIWQVAALGLLALVLVELTGIGRGLVRLVWREAEPAPSQTEAASAARPPQPWAPAETPALGRESGAAGLPPPMAKEVVRDSSPKRDEIEEQPEGTPFAGLAQNKLGRPAPRTVADSGQVNLNREDRGESAAPNRAERQNAAPPVFPTAPAPDVSKRAASPAAAVSDAPSAYASWPGMIWLLGAVVIAIRVAWSRRLLARFRRRQAATTDKRLRQRVDALARQLGIGPRVAVLEAEGLTSPVAFGTFRPTLVLPAGFSQDFDPHEQDAVLAHELAHLAASDPAWQCLADLTCAVLWWHPLSWWSRRQLRLAGEAAADEASRLVPDGPDLLAACLVTLGRRLVGVPRQRLGWLSVGGPRFRSNLGRRVDRLLSGPKGSWRPPGRQPLALARSTLPVVLVLVAVFCTAWVRPQAVLAEGGTTMNVLKSSWRHSLAAAALLAFWGPLSSDALSQEGEGERDTPIVVQTEERAESGERREREARDRERGERRERDAERRERPDREASEAEALKHQIEVLRLATPALREKERGDAIELVERAIRARQVTLEGRRDDEAQMIRERAPNPGQLAEVLTVAANLWREFGDGEKAAACANLVKELARPEERERERPDRERERPDRERPDRERRRDVERPERPRGEGREAELMQRRRELMQKAEAIKRELAGLRDDQDAEARELKAAYERIQAQLRALVPRRRDPGSEERLEVFRRLQELKQALARAQEKAGGEDEAERIKGQIAEITQGLRRRMERPVEVRDVRRPPAAIPPQVRQEMEELEEVVRDLRAQVQEMRAQMEEMRNILRRMAEREGDRPREEARERGGDRPREEARERGGDRPREEARERAD